MVDFLVIGNVVAVHYDEVFPLIMKERIFFGYSISSGDRKFRVPDDYEFYGYKYSIEEGEKYIWVKGIRWFSNISDYYPPKLELKKHYNEIDYDKFDNYDCINIDRISDIPSDYDGLMGVPITFLDKWNPEQFELIGLFCDKRNGKYLINGDSRYINEGHKSYVGPVIDGKAFFTRLLIKKKIS